MNLPFANQQARHDNCRIQDALSLANQRVQPIRQDNEPDFYSKMIKRLNDKPSVEEIVQAYSHA